MLNTHPIDNKVSKREVHYINHCKKHIKPFKIKFTHYYQYIILKQYLFLFILLI